jgi:hypothetical protein
MSGEASRSARVIWATSPAADAERARVAARARRRRRRTFGASVLVVLAAALAVVLVVVLGGRTAPLPAPIQKQMNYALTYWNHYNLKTYGDLNPVGGDCANFVSQTLIARGWKMNSEWYNDDGAASWSPAWGYAPAMDDYFSANAKQLGLTEYSFDQRSHIADGDVAMFDWTDDGSIDHVMVVTKVVDTTIDGKKSVEIDLTGHNKDDLDKSLDTILKEYPDATGHFWHIALPSKTKATAKPASNS